MIIKVDNMDTLEFYGREFWTIVRMEIALKKKFEAELAELKDKRNAKEKQFKKLKKELGADVEIGKFNY
jgi:cell division protein FtsB